jgi:DNA-binding FadR family transcriptional regulator
MPLTAARKHLIDELMDFVRGNGYAPGDRLPSIRELAEKLSVGRNAVRDGLLEAQTIGLVKIEPRLGVFLKHSGPDAGADGLAATLETVLTQEDQNLFHLVDARLLVEAELAGAAARDRRPDDLLPLREALDAVLGEHADRLAYIRADETFHLAVARVAGNRVLLAFLQALWRMILPAKMNLLLSAANRAQSDREHCEAFQSIVDGNAERAQAVVRAHIDRGRVLLHEYVRTLPRGGSSKARPL